MCKRLRTEPGSLSLLNKYQPLLIENLRHLHLFLGNSLPLPTHPLSVISLNVVSPLGSCTTAASAPWDDLLGREACSTFRVSGIVDFTKGLRTTILGSKQSKCKKKRTVGRHWGNLNTSQTVDDVKELLMC